MKCLILLSTDQVCNQSETFKNVYQPITALGVFPGDNWPERLKDVLMKIAPAGADNIITMMCGTCSSMYFYRTF